MSLFWTYDPEGYEIVPEKELSPSLPLAAGETIPARIKGKSGRSRADRDVFKLPGIYERLAEVTDEASALEFANWVGLLRGGKSQPLDAIYQAAASIRRLIALRDDENWVDLIGFFGGLRLSHDVVLVPGRPLDFFFQPQTLEIAIYMQLAQDVSGGVELRRCKRQGCPNWFKVGLAAGGLKATAIFCSSKCQKMHQYATKVKGRKK